MNYQINQTWTHWADTERDREIEQISQPWHSKSPPRNNSLPDPVPRGRRKLSAGKAREQDAIRRLVPGASGNAFALSDVTGHLAELCCDADASRFVQAALQACSATERSAAIAELVPAAASLAADTFGNYCMQRCLELGDEVAKAALVAQLARHCRSLSEDQHGCRVVQRALETTDEVGRTVLTDSLDNDLVRLCRHQFGNHVVQKIVTTSSPARLSTVLERLATEAVELAAHGYGCRVMQRVLEREERDLIGPVVQVLLAATADLATSQFGNYVAQHLLVRGTDEDRSTVLQRLREAGLLTMARHKYASNVVELVIQHASDDDRALLVRDALAVRNGTLVLLSMAIDSFGNYCVGRLLDSTTGADHDALLSALAPHRKALRRYPFGKHLAAKLDPAKVSSPPSPPTRGPAPSGRRGARKQKQSKAAKENPNK